MSEDDAMYTEGVCEDGAAILCEGVILPITEVLHRLNAYHDAIYSMRMELDVMGILGGSRSIEGLAPEIEKADAILDHVEAYPSVPTPE